MLAELKRIIAYIKTLKDNPVVNARIKHYRSLTKQPDFKPQIEISQTGKKSLLVCHSRLYSGGAEIALLNMLANIPQDIYDVTLLLWYDEKAIEEPYLSEARKYACVILHKDLFWDRTVFEKTLYRLIYWRGANGLAGLLFKHTAVKRAVRYLLGNQQFDYGIDWFGIHVIDALITRAASRRAFIWQHTDILRSFDAQEEINRQSKTDYSLSIKALKTLYGLFDGIVSVGKAIMEINIRKLRFNSKLTQKTSYVTNFIDYKRISLLKDEPLDGELRAILDQLENRVKFCYLGRLSYEKNLPNLVLGFCRLVLKLRNSRRTGGTLSQSEPLLFLIGGGPLLSELQGIASGAECDDNLICVGNLSNPFPLLKEMDCFILASHFEAFSLSLHEARILNLAILLAEFEVAESLTVPHGQLIVNHTAEGLAAGMEAFLDGRFSNDYAYDALEHNEKSLHELTTLLG